MGSASSPKGGLNAIEARDSAVGILESCTKSETVHLAKVENGATDILTTIRVDRNTSINS